MSSKERRDLSRREPEYKRGDQVLVRRPVNDHTGVPEGGKLAPVYEGPYRVTALLDHGNVQLRDLKSRGLHDVFHVTRLRPYLTYTSDLPLEEDEYIVERIVSRRGTAENREYLVKWKGYSNKSNTWEPQAHLMRRCMDEVAAFDAARDEATEPETTANRPHPSRTLKPPHTPLESSGSEQCQRKRKPKKRAHLTMTRF